MSLWDWFRRWRATRGYGIHSPLAFRLATRVIRPEKGVIYYGEEKLSVAESPVKDILRARLLLRLVADLQPAYVWTSPGLPQIYTDAISLAGCVVRVFDGKFFPDRRNDVDMTVFAGDKVRKKDMQKFLRPGTSMIGLGIKQSLIARVPDLFKGGVVLKGKHSVIAVSTDDPQVNSYEILMP